MSDQKAGPDSIGMQLCRREKESLPSRWQYMEFAIIVYEEEGAGDRLNKLT